MITIAISLGFLGLCFGSFINALVWRTRQQALKNQKSKIKKQKEFSILTGRSQCPNCHHQLAAKDLIPIVSWLLLKGRCRYCKKPISKQYPLVEILTAAVFTASYLYWPVDLQVQGQWLLLVIWLAASIGLISLAVYDWHWMLLPNGILYPTFFVALAGRLIYIFIFSPDPAHSSWLLALSLLIAAGLFWIIYELSRGKAIGFGDVRLGLVTGTLLATPINSFLMIFAASILGTLFALPGLISRRRMMTSRIPYGPFLIAATFLVVLFGQPIIDWYERLLT